MDTLLGKVKNALLAHKLLEASFGNIVEFINIKNVPEWAINSLQELVDNEKWEELNNRFFKPIEFGTAGMRGRCIGHVPTSYEKEGEGYVHAAIGSAYINDFNVITVTIGLFNYCKSYLETVSEYPRRPSVVIAHDSRYFSRHFCELVASTWGQLGGDAYIFDGPRSTPQLSFSVRYLKTTAGVMLTASHNPFFDNGYKVYFNDGAQICEAHASGITRNIHSVDCSDIVKFLDKDFRYVLHLSPLIDEAYLECCKEAILDTALFRTLKRTKIVYTPLHGTGSVCILPLLKNYEWNVLPLESQLKMDGAFPTVKSPNPDNLETLELALEEARRSDADGIIATDPDGDRMSAMLKDSKGEWCLLNGNTIAILLAEYRLQAMKRLDLLPKKLDNMVIVKSFVTTPLLKSFAEKNGMRLIETHTGFKWIGEKLKDYERVLTDYMLRSRGLSLDYTRCSYKARKNLMFKYSTFFFLGAEESCGFLANDAVRDKDANAAAIMFCEFIAYLKEKELNFSDYLDEIYYKYGYFKEDLLSFTFEGANGLNKIKHLMDSYRKNAPKRMNDVRVLTFNDFFKIDQLKDADGKIIPASNFVIIRLLDGCSIAIRPSGTEPKLKMYLFGQAEVTEDESLPDIKALVDKRLGSLKDWLRKDVEARVA